MSLIPFLFHVMDRGVIDVKRKWIRAMNEVSEAVKTFTSISFKSGLRWANVIRKYLDEGHRKKLCFPFNCTRSKPTKYLNFPAFPDCDGNSVIMVMVISDCERLGRLHLLGVVGLYVELIVCLSTRSSHPANRFIRVIEYSQRGPRGIGFC